MKLFCTPNPVGTRPGDTFQSLRTGTLSACAMWMLRFACTAYIGCLPALAEDHTPSAAELDAGYIFKNNCSVCHGDNGDGKSRARTSLFPPPRNFTEASDLTREKMIYAVTNGKPNTAMTSWKTQLSEKQIAAVVDYVRSNFMQAIIEGQLSSGRLVYGHNCIACHGDRGQGVKPSWFAAAPRSFAGSKLDRERMIAAVTHGLPGTAMPSYANKLPAELIEAVVEYIRDKFMTDATEPTPTPPPPTARQQIPASPADTRTSTVDMRLPLPDGLIGDPRPGEQFFMQNCATCHGTLGNGQGPRAYFMTTKPRNFLDDYSRTTLNRPAIFSAITLGRQGTEMPAWGKVLSKQEIANVAEFVFQSFMQSGAK